MLCPRCGAELFPGMTECPECGCPVYGATVRTATIVVTSKEARRGTFKSLRLPQQVMPVKVRIKPGTRNGAKLSVNNALFALPDGENMLMPVKVTVVVKRGPIWVPLMVALLSLSVLACAWRVGTALVNPTDPDARIEATVPDPTRSTQPLETIAPAVQPEETGIAETLPVESRPPETAPKETLPSETQPQSSYDGDILYYELRPLLHQLSPELLENLEAIYDSAMAFETSCQFPNPMNPEEMSYLMELMHTEFPELMQIDNTVTSTYYTDGTTGRVISYDLPLVLTEQQYDAQYAAVTQVIDQLVAETQGMTDWEKEKYVFDYITDTCTYSMDGAYAYTPYGTLVDRVAKCDGISLAMKWTMEEMGITCLCISGDPTVTEVGHAWNMIRLDGDYYNVDVTMDVRKAEDNGPRLYCALNVTNEMVLQSYVLDDVYQELLTIPQVTTMEKSYHVQQGSYVRTGSDWKERIRDAFLESYESGEPQLLQFESKTDFETCLAGMDDEIKAVAADANIWGVSWSKWYSEDFCVIHLSVTTN